MCLITCEYVISEMVTINKTTLADTVLLLCHFVHRTEVEMLFLITFKRALIFISFYSLKPEVNPEVNHAITSASVY